VASSDRHGAPNRFRSPSPFPCTTSSETAIITTATTSTPHTTRKPRPADRCRLTVTIRGAAYTARPIRPETSEVARAWRLCKVYGTTYTVADTIDGTTCDCTNLVFRHEGHDQVGCKHVRALRALGLIDPEGEDASEWRAWIDTHTCSVAH
jgi:hypothetical protein